MAIRISGIVAALILCWPIPCEAASKSSKEAIARKGQLVLKLTLQKTKVSVDRSLWYKLELKNIGKRKVRLFDAIFRDPNAIHVNSNLKDGIYIEVLDNNGVPVPVKWGEFRTRYDWEGPEGTPWKLTKQETRELDALVMEWNKKGMTAQQQSIAQSDWFKKLSNEKNVAELKDPAHQRWLAPGASTSTIASSSRGPGEYPDRSKDDESLREGYAELWAFPLLNSGTYRVRAVYDYALTPSTEKRFKKRGLPADPAAIRFKTPFIEVQVVP